MRELTSEQMRRLKIAKAAFPSYTGKEFDRTALKMQNIDTGEAEPIKQRHYTVSPAIQKLLYP